VGLVVVAVLVAISLLALLGRTAEIARSDHLLVVRAVRVVAVVERHRIALLELMALMELDLMACRPEE
jgi:hypothetical protein